MHSKSDKLEIMINDEDYEVIKQVFDSPKNIYQNNRWKVVCIDCRNYIHSLYHKCHDSPDWVNIKNNNNKSYQ